MFILIEIYLINIQCLYDRGISKCFSIVCVSDYIYARLSRTLYILYTLDNDSSHHLYNRLQKQSDHAYVRRQQQSLHCVTFWISVIITPPRDTS